MQTLTPRFLRRLVEVDDDPVLSIHVPTHRAGRETIESRIHVKNAVDEVRDTLQDRGVDKRAIDRRLSPLSELAEDRDYWQQQGDGLSLFQFEDELLDVPVGRVDERFVHVGPYAHILPLVPALAASRPFAALLMSANRVALFTVRGESITEVDEPDLAKSFKELGKYIEEEKQLQFHTGAPQAGAPGDRNAVFHGQGAGSATEKKTRQAEFSRLVDEPLSRYFQRTESLPLVVIAAEPMHSIYLDSSKYDKLVKTEATGNADHMGDDAILQRARSLAEPILDGPERDILAKMKEQLGSDRVVFGTEEVIKSAADGRIERLIGASDHHVWGSADLTGATRTIDVHEKRKPGDEDLQNLAFITAYRTGATLHALPAEDLPADRPLLAQRRY